MINFFQEGGKFMYLVLEANILVLVISIFSIFFGRLKFRVACLGIALVPLGIGYFAYHHGMASAYSAVQLADPDMREELLMMSREYALKPLYFGLVSSLVFLMMVGGRIAFEIFGGERSGQ